MNSGISTAASNKFTCYLQPNLTNKLDRTRTGFSERVSVTTTADYNETMVPSPQLAVWGGGGGGASITRKQKMQNSTTFISV